MRKAMGMRSAVVISLVFLAGVGTGVALARWASSPKHGAIAPDAPSSSEPSIAAPTLPKERSAEAEVFAPSSPVKRRPTAGTGVITGRVRTAAMSPLVGAEVIAGRIPGDTLQVATTNEEGAYRLESLPSGPFVMEARRDGFQIFPEDPLGAAATEPGAIIDFTACRLFKVPASVVDAEGAAVEAARIQWTNLSDRRPAVTDLTWTRVVGVLELPEGRHELRAFNPQDARVASQTVREWVQEGTPCDPIDFVLRTRLGITGRVLVNPREESPSVGLHLVRWDKSEPPQEKLVIASAAHADAQRSAGYRFAFDDLRPGPYWLGATRFPDRMELETRVELGSSPVELELNLPEIDPRECIQVHVLGPRGEPLSDVEISERCQDATSSSGAGARSVRLASGTFAVLPDLKRSPCDARDARHTISVRSMLYGERTVEFSPGSPQILEVRFDDLAWLTVRLEGAAKDSLQNLIILSLNPRGEGLSTNVGATRAADDSYEFPPVAAGAYELEVGLRADVNWHGGGGGMGLLAHAVQLDPGPTVRSIRLPNLHTLTVLVPGASESVRIELSGRSDTTGCGILHWTQLIDADGRVQFADIPEDTYGISCETGDLEGEMELNLSGEATVRFEPKPYTSIRVSVRGGDSHLARAGFLDGDRIVGLDLATVPTGLRSIRDVIRKLSGGDGHVVCEIVRGGETLRLEVDGTAFRRDGHGGLAPAPAPRQ
jgi:hypothetical protein